MLGAIFGDIVGSAYEFDNTNDYNFKLLTDQSCPTDDTYMTLAVANALMDSIHYNDKLTYDALASEMHRIGNKHKEANYGDMFFDWLLSDEPEPYNSFGNGSAMRVSSVGWLYNSLQKTIHYARMSAFVTHNHPEGIKGAEAVAVCIFFARNGKSKDFIRSYVKENYYDLSDSHRFHYFDETCMGTVPVAINCFLNSTNYYDAIRKAVSHGGDSDTIACITGGIAEAHYGLPADCTKVIRSRIKDKELLGIIDKFSRYKRPRIDYMGKKLP